MKASCLESQSSFFDEYGLHGAAQHNTESVVGRFQEIEDVWIAYWKYIQTIQRILTIEEQLQTKELLWFMVLLQASGTSD